MELTLLLPGIAFPWLRSAVTLIRSGGATLLVDSGPVADGDRLAAALARRGVAPEAMDFVVATHLHYDHCGNHLRFPRARYLVGASDLDDTRSFMACFHGDSTPNKDLATARLRGRNEAVKPFYLRAIVREVNNNLDFYNRVLEGDPRFVPVSGPCWLTPEVEIIPTAGHTPGHLSVIAHGVRLPGGDRPVDVLLAGDAVPDARSLGAGGDADVAMAADLALYRRTRARLVERYRFIVPGHGSLVDRDSRRAPDAALTGAA